MRSALAAAPLLRVLAAVAFASPALATSGAADGGLQQAVIFDAGSTGTRVHVFNFRRTAGAHVPDVDQTVRRKQTKKVKPGLSHFAERGDLAGAQQSIEELLAFAESFVDPPRRASTPVLLKATAGLRAVRETSPEGAEAVLRRVSEVLAASAYLSDGSQTEIIGGNEEGGLAWIAANYLAGTFDMRPAAAGSLGVIEMGGVSTQVCFQIGEETDALDADTYVFTTALGARFRVYSHSYHGYGQDHQEAAWRRGSPSQAPRADLDPCYPSWHAYARRRGDAASVARGSGDGPACRAGVAEDLLRSPAAADAPGGYGLEPPLRGRFVALENFFYTRNDLGLPMLGDAASMEAVVDEVCARAEPPPPPYDEDPKHCFSLAYQAAVLGALRTRAAQARRDDARGEAGELEIEIAREIGGGEVDWALGAVIQLAIAAPPLVGGLPAAAPEEL